MEEEQAEVRVRGEKESNFPSKFFNYSTFTNACIDTPMLRLLSLVVLLLAASIAAFAFGPNPRPDDPSRVKRPLHLLTQQNWKKKDGLPQNFANPLTQTPDGYLWIGTQEGLARFDGVQFRVFNRKNTPEFKVNIITTLFVDRDSVLWIGTFGGGVLSYKNGAFRSFTYDHGLANDRVQAIYQDGNGYLWIGTGGGGVSVLQEDTIRTFDMEDGLLSDFVVGVTEDDHRNLLVATRRGISRREGEAFVPHVALPSPEDRISFMYRDKNTMVWIGTDSRNLYALREGAFRKPAFAMKPFPFAVNRMLMEEDGTVWLATREGLRRITMKGTSVVVEVGLPEEEVRGIFQDHTGSIWAGSTPGGLYRFSEGSFVTYETGQTQRQNITNALFKDRLGGIWAGTGAGELLRFNGEQFITEARIPHGPREIIWSIMEFEGSMWVGTGRGLYRKEGAQLVEQFKDSLWGGSILALDVDRDGSLLVGSWMGLYRVRKGSIQKVYIKNITGIASISSLHRDRKGDLWVTSLGGGIFRIRGDSATRYSHQDGLPTLIFGNILEDSEGKLWFGSTGSGLISFHEGAFRALTTSNGLFDDNVLGLLEDDTGHFWMSSNNGIFRIGRTSLIDFIEGRTDMVHSLPFDETDGMRESECNGGNQASAEKSKDGKLWFATAHGVAVVDPATITEDVAPPRPLLESLKYDRSEIRWPGSQVALAPGLGDLEFYFNAPYLTAPHRVRFQYRLSGYQQEWVNAGTRKAAYYTNIPPGEYTFVVKATMGDREWEGNSASIVVSIQPHFYQRWWFFGLMGGAVFIIGAFSYRLYQSFQEKERRATMLESQLAQAQLKALKMQLHPHFLFNTLNAISGFILKNPRGAIKMISRLSDLLRTTLEMEMVHLVPLRMEMEFLQRYLEIEKIRFAEKLQVRFELPEHTLDAMVPTLLLQPLVENAVSHGISKKAKGGTIVIRAETVGSMLKLEVWDNGLGLNGFQSVEQAAEEGGIGLLNTKTRLAQLFGEAHSVSISGAEGGGVVVQLTLPLQYKDAHKEPGRKYADEKGKGSHRRR